MATWYQILIPVLLVMALGWCKRRAIRDKLSSLCRRRDGPRDHDQAIIPATILSYAITADDGFPRDDYEQGIYNDLELTTLIVQNPSVFEPRKGILIEGDGLPNGFYELQPIDTPLFRLGAQETSRPVFRRVGNYERKLIIVLDGEGDGYRWRIGPDNALYRRFNDFGTFTFAPCYVPQPSRKQEYRLQWRQYGSYPSRSKRTNTELPDFDFTPRPRRNVRRPISINMNQAGDCICSGACSCSNICYCLCPCCQPGTARPCTVELKNLTREDLERMLPRE